MENSKGISLLSKVQGLNSIKPNDSLVFPLRLLVSKFATADSLIRLKFNLRDEEDRLYTSSSLFLRIERQELLFYSLLTSDIYFRPGELTSTAAFQIQNSGNAGKRIRLAFDLPQGLDTAQQKPVFFIPSGTDTVIRYTFSRIPNYPYDGNTPIAYRILDETNTIVKSGAIVVYILSTEKNYTAPPAFLPGSNFVEAFANGIYSPYQNYYIYGSGTSRFEQNSFLNYRYRLFYFDQIGQLQIRDSYLAYENAHYAMNIGDLSEIYEKNLYGRGAKLTLKGERSTWEGFGNFNNYQSQKLSEFFQQPSSTSYLIKNSFKINANYTLTNGVVYEQDYVNRTTGILYATESRIRLGRNQQAKLLTGISREQYLNAPGANFIIWAPAGGLTYTSEGKRFDIRSYTYITGKDYAGTQRGLVQMNHALLYKIKQGALAGITYFQRSSNPHFYLDGVLLPEFQLEDKKMGALFSREFNKHLISFQPLFQQQAVTDRLLGSSKGELFRSNSPRVITEYQLKPVNAGTMNAALDLGIVSIPGIKTQPITAQFRLNYTYKRMSVFGLYNSGPYYVYDQLRYAKEGVYQSNLTFYPQYTFSFFSGKLTSQLILGYGYDSNFETERKSVTNESTVAISKSFDFVIRGDYTRYNRFDRFEMRIGLRKRFSRIYSKTVDLEMVFFKDLNSNGKKEGDEPYFEGVIVGIGNSILLSDEKGSLRYNKLPPGRYNPVIMNVSDWFTPYSLSLNFLLEKDKRMLIPLQRGAQLKGKITASTDTLSSTVLDGLANIRITAVDTAGNTYYALSNYEGNFSFYMPYGNYLVSINPEILGPTFKLVPASIPVALIEGEKTVFPVFAFREEGRKREIKVFSSKGQLVETHSNYAESNTTTISFVYTVEVGNSVQSVADKFGVDADELRIANVILDDKILPGQKLTIAKVYRNNKLINYTVLPEDNLFELAKKTGMSAEEIVALNKLSSFSLYVGQTLKILKVHP